MPFPALLQRVTTNGRLDAAGAEKLFLAELKTLERAIRFACLRAGLHDQDAEDFASYVKLKLIDEDYAVIRKYEGRSPFGAFLSIVVQRMLLGYRISQWGKWPVSAQAKHLGEPAIVLEAMLYRDGRALEEIFPALLRRWPTLTREGIEVLARELPVRIRRPRAVDLELARDAVGLESDSVLDGAFVADRSALSRRIGEIVRATVSELADEDRAIFRLRFEGGLTVAEISRVLCIERKPLYRRLQRSLFLLRKQLEKAGIEEDVVGDLLARGNTDFDFGFDSRAAVVMLSPPDLPEEDS